MHAVILDSHHQSEDSTEPQPHRHQYDLNGQVKLVGVLDLHAEGVFNKAHLVRSHTRQTRAIVLLAHPLSLHHPRVVSNILRVTRKTVQLLLLRYYVLRHHSKTAESNQKSRNHQRQL